MATAKISLHSQAVPLRRALSILTRLIKQRARRNEGTQVFQDARKILVAIRAAR